MIAQYGPLAVSDAISSAAAKADRSKRDHAQLIAQELQRWNLSAQDLDNHFAALA